APMATIVGKPDTEAGVLRLVVVPSPSWPFPFKPQAHTVPSLLSARACELPTATAVMFDKPPTVTGDVRCGVGVSPNCPLLLNPHARRVRSLRRATLNALPAATATAVLRLFT